ncbi:MAG: hypothetical protein Q4C96_04180 [Planctomycetia bacterium]|nr:hypothetical protein [Planctomycetia bacterium]
MKVIMKRLFYAIVATYFLVLVLTGGGLIILDNNDCNWKLQPESSDLDLHPSCFYGVNNKKERIYRFPGIFYYQFRDLESVYSVSLYIDDLPTDEVLHLKGTMILHRPNGASEELSWETDTYVAENLGGFCHYFEVPLAKTIVAGKNLLFDRVSIVFTASDSKENTNTYRAEYVLEKRGCEVRASWHLLPDSYYPPSFTGFCP